MSKFKNDETGVVVSVADEKDGRFTDGWSSASTPEKKSAAASKKPETPERGSKR